MYAGGLVTIDFASQFILKRFPPSLLNKIFLNALLEIN